MNFTSGMKTSIHSEAETPQEFFEAWDSVYHFTIDVCANEKNHKCERYYTEEQDGLAQDWSGETVWCNPPYGREIGKWLKKCYEEAAKPNTTVVALLPARTDTKWFHDYVLHRAVITFIKGRLKFVGWENNAPFPSMVCVWY